MSDSNLVFYSREQATALLLPYLLSICRTESVAMKCTMMSASQNNELTGRRELSALIEDIVSN